MIRLKNNSFNSKFETKRIPDGEHTLYIKDAKPVKGGFLVTCVTQEGGQESAYYANSSDVSLGKLAWLYKVVTRCPKDQQEGDPADMIGKYVHAQVSHTAKTNANGQPGEWFNLSQPDFRDCFEDGSCYADSLKPDRDAEDLLNSL